MARSLKSPGYRLPVNPEQKNGKIAHGFVTPKQDKIPKFKVFHLAECCQLFLSQE